MAEFRTFCPDPNIRAPKEAVKLAQKACTLTGFADAVAVNVLANAYAQLGDLTAAFACMEKAVGLTDSPAMREMYNQFLASYRAGNPLRPIPGPKKSLRR